MKGVVAQMKEIVFAGGCFWGVEAYFKLIDGVMTSTVGYANGHKANPTYEEVCSKKTGHTEACHLAYDDSKISLTELLKAYWAIVDPTLLNRQGPDIGEQYRTGIYFTDQDDLEIINTSKLEEQKKYSTPIVTEIQPLTKFWDAEAYHQDYLEKNPYGYCHIPLDEIRKKMNKS
jgi:peptide-methionine (S)-S-oxide reductase